MMASTMTGHDDDAARRAERRAFIRAQHPDAGGDPAAFMSGLQQFDASSRDRNGLPKVYRSRRLDRVLRRAVRDVRRRITGEQPPRTLQ